MGLLSDAKLQAEGMKVGVPWGVIKRRRKEGLTGDALLAPIGGAERTPQPQLQMEPEVASMAVKVKSYKNDKEFEKDAGKMMKDGWRLQAQSGKERHTAIGRTAGKALLTGGVGLLLSGRSKKGDSVTAMWVK
jgi:hypothetical protein